MNALFRTVLLATCFVTVSVSGQATQPVWQNLPQGQLILRPFVNAPYPHPSREEGFKGRGTMYPKDPHYVDSTVGIFVPAGYTPGATVDYVVHFHGHGNHVSKVMTQYKLAEQFTAAKLNAILIVPQGPRDASDSGGGKLELEKGGFEKLIDEVTKYLRAEGKINTDRVGKIVLSTHSGGYKVTAAILDHGGLADHITDVLLLDSSYGSLEWYANWAAASPSHRLISLHTQHLDAANKELMGLLDKGGVEYAEREEGTATEEQLASRGVTFIPVKGPHDEIPNQYFGRLLKGSALAK